MKNNWEFIELLAGFSNCFLIKLLDKKTHDNTLFSPVEKRAAGRHTTLRLKTSASEWNIRCLQTKLLPRRGSTSHSSPFPCLLLPWDTYAFQENHLLANTVPPLPVLLRIVPYPILLIQSQIARRINFARPLALSTSVVALHSAAPPHSFGALQHSFPTLISIRLLDLILKLNSHPEMANIPTLPTSTHTISFILTPAGRRKEILSESAQHKHNFPHHHSLYFSFRFLFVFQPNRIKFDSDQSALFNGHFQCFLDFFSNHAHTNRSSAFPHRGRTRHKHS